MKYSLIAILLFSFTALQAQVKGTVKDNLGDPIAGGIAAGHLEGGTQYLKAEHKRGKEPDELVTARIEVGDQMELLF